MRGIWLDAGRGDEFNLDLAAMALHRALGEAGVAREATHFELFDGGHSGIGWRYPLALAWLTARLT